MAVQFIDLPSEIQVNILSYLRHEDLTHTMLVSKNISKLTEPLLWTHIEVHDPKWHDCRNQAGRLSGFDEPPTRNYIESGEVKIPTEMYTEYLRSEFLLERTASFLRAVSVVRKGQVLHHVRSLCLSLDILMEDRTPPEDTYELFSRFNNLQSLDLTVEWPYSAREWDALAERFNESNLPPPLVHLRTLRLRGYIPRLFARWLLLGSKKLSALELAILDRPISGSIAYSLRNPPPSRPQDQNPLEDIEDDDDDGGPIPWVTETSDTDSNSSYNEEAIAPRTLSILDPSDPLDITLQNLTTLTLTRPVRARDNNFDDDIYHSTRCDTAILHEWTRFLRASRKTLTHMTLDQCPIAPEIELDTTTEYEFMNDHPYGPGTMRFTEIVLPVLLNEDTSWPALRSISLFGFDVGELLLDEDPDDRPWDAESFMPALKRRFRSDENGVTVGLDSQLGTRMTFEPETGVVVGYDGVGEGWWYPRR